MPVAPASNWAYSSMDAPRKANLQTESESTTAFVSSDILMSLALPSKLNRSVAPGFRRISWLMG
jgi:hypothetical protein